MKIDLVAYAFVEPDGVVPKCEFGPVARDVYPFFESHISQIRRRAADGVIDPAVFVAVEEDKPGAERFEALRSASKGRFLGAAQELADQLHDTTDHRMNRGFFVALRASDDGVVFSSVLKLDVYDVPAARLALRDGGAAFFESVEGLLDLPGDLHKGAVYPDPRTDSEIAVVDRFRTQYFLESIDARMLLRGREAAASFMGTVRSVAGPEVAKTVASGLADHRKPVRRNRALQLVPAEHRQQVADRMRDRSRSVDTVDPAQITRTLRADGITIKGPLNEMRDRVKTRRHGAGWRTTIDFDTEPETTEA